MTTYDTQIVTGIHLPAYDTHFPSALYASRLIDGKGTYQLQKLEAALAFCRYSRRALDIGAHVGLWSRVLARCFDHVIAYEPVPLHVHCLRLNCVSDNVNVVDACALGAGPGFMYMSLPPGNSGNARAAADGESIAGAVGVPVQALDDVLSLDLAAGIDFVKIDVEGYELAVVRGAEQTIRTAKPVMVVEQKPGYAERYGFRTGEVIDLLKSWGARVEWVKAGDYCLTWA